MEITVHKQKGFIPLEFLIEKESEFVAIHVALENLLNLSLPSHAIFSKEMVIQMLQTMDSAFKLPLSSYPSRN